MSARELRIDIAGDVVEWQTLLSGMQVTTLEGVSADGAWALSGSCSWNPRTGPEATEGDLMLSRGDGAELFATLVAGTVIELPSDTGESAGYEVRLDLAIDGGSGELQSATGSIHIEGGVSRESVSLQLGVTVD